MYLWSKLFVTDKNAGWQGQHVDEGWAASGRLNVKPSDQPTRARKEGGNVNIMLLPRRIADNVALGELALHVR